MCEDEAFRIAAASGIEEWGQAYRYVAWLAECELSDGRGGEELHQACETILGELRRRADLEQRAA